MLARVALLVLLSTSAAFAIEWRTDLTEAQIRATHWGHDARHVTAAMKRYVYWRDGYTGPRDSRCPCEVDHEGPRCLGGADTVANLRIQPYSGEWNAYMKDRLEDYACAQFRGYALVLRSARLLFENDWRSSYVRVFGSPQ